VGRVKKPPLPETREVVCTHCERSIEIPSAAMSVNCRHCNKRVIIEDLKIKAYHSVVRLATAGKVEVAKNAQVIARVRVDELIVNGTIKGDVTALSRIEVGKKGAIYGDVVCRTISIQPGAKLSGHFVIDPRVVLKQKELATDEV
jgi:DNA-directed RNA polymerase subunit RPC12/RpoP